MASIAAGAGQVLWVREMRSRKGMRLMLLMTRDRYRSRSSKTRRLEEWRS